MIGQACLLLLVPCENGHIPSIPADGVGTLVPACTSEYDFAHHLHLAALTIYELVRRKPNAV